MAEPARIVVVDFEHHGARYKKGDKVDAHHPLVELAPHLFVPLKTKPAGTDPEQRIRGPLVNTPKEK